MSLSQIVISKQYFYYYERLEEAYKMSTLTYYMTIMKANVLFDKLRSGLEASFSPQKQKFLLVRIQN